MSVFELALLLDEARVDALVASWRSRHGRALDTGLSRALRGLPPLADERLARARRLAHAALVAARLESGATLARSCYCWGLGLAGAISCLVLPHLATRVWAGPAFLAVGALSALYNLWRGPSFLRAYEALEREVLSAARDSEDACRPEKAP